MERVNWGNESVTERLEYALGRRTAMTAKERVVMDSLPAVIDAPVFSLSSLDDADRAAAIQPRL